MFLNVITVSFIQHKRLHSEEALGHRKIVNVQEKNTMKHLKVVVKGIGEQMLQSIHQWAL